jgi:hypothetical protein
MYGSRKGYVLPFSQAPKKAKYQLACYLTLSKKFFQEKECKRRPTRSPQESHMQVTEKTDI